MPANRTYLTQADVSAILQSAEAFARENVWAVTICVVDDGGHLLGMLRRDGAAPVTAYIAQEKARAAALGRRETKIYEDIINQGRTASWSFRGWRQYCRRWPYNWRDWSFGREV